MSMLSAQVDELRAMAESIGLAMPQTATLMMKAADTIWELRGTLQVAIVDYRRLQDENAKLRELVSHMHECMSNIDADGNYECDSCEYENTEGKCDFGRRMRELGVSDGTE